MISSYASPQPWRLARARYHTCLSLFSQNCLSVLFFCASFACSFHFLYLHPSVASVPLFVCVSRVWGWRNRQRVSKKKKKRRERNVKSARVIALVFVLLSLFSLWLQSGAAQVTLIRPAEALAEIVLCWVMVELKLSGGSMLDRVWKEKRRNTSKWNKYRKMQNKGNINSYNARNTQHLSEYNRQVNFRLIQRGGDLDNKALHFILSGTLSYQRDVTLLPEWDCWEIVSRLHFVEWMEEQAGMLGFSGQWQWYCKIGGEWELRMPPQGQAQLDTEHCRGPVRM